MLEERLGEDTRVTILGHVQRGGAPSAFDRSMSSMLGHAAAVEEVLAATPESVPQLVGIRGNRVVRVPLMECVARTRELADRIAAKDFDTALTMRGDSYTEMIHVFHSISHALPSHRHHGRSNRIGRAQRRRARAGDERGGARPRSGSGWTADTPCSASTAASTGLIDGEVRELQWGDVEGWTGRGGAELGISRHVPTVKDLYAIGRGLEQHRRRRAADHRRLGRVRGGAHAAAASGSGTRPSRSR